MAKKRKKSIELLDKEISFTLQKEHCKVIRFYPDAMNLDVIAFSQSGEKIGVKNIPFSYIPKEVKKLVKPK